jgi:hypothetical protein
VNALYDTIGSGYRDYRRPDPRIAAVILDALGDAKSAVNSARAPGLTSRGTVTSSPSSRPRP